MTAVRVAIIDDEQEERNTLQIYLDRYASECGHTIETDQYSCADDLLRDYRLIYDILIFDIDMPGTNGMDAARLVRERDKSVVILFVTNMAQYAINGYEVEAVDYIIKPIGYYDFAMKFRRAVGRVAHGRERELLVETTEGSRRVPVSNIIYVEIQGHYLIYHLKSGTGQAGELRVRGNMRAQEQQLSSYSFCQAHKSYLVNLEYVEEIRTNEVMVGGAAIPVGRSFKNQLGQEYLRFVRG